MLAVQELVELNQEELYDYTHNFSEKQFNQLTHDIQKEIERCEKLVEKSKEKLVKRIKFDTYDFLQHLDNFRITAVKKHVKEPKTELQHLGNLYLTYKYIKKVAHTNTRLCEIRFGLPYDFDELVESIPNKTIQERLRFLRNEIRNDPDEYKIHIESLRSVVSFILVVKPPQPNIGICHGGGLELYWRYPHGSIVIDFDRNGKNTASKLLKDSKPKTYKNAGYFELGSVVKVLHAEACKNDPYNPKLLF